MKERNYIKLSVEIKKTFGSNIIEQILKNKAGNTYTAYNNRFETKLAQVFQDISCMNRAGKVVTRTFKTLDLIKLHISYSVDNRNDIQSSVSHDI